MDAASAPPKESNLEPTQILDYNDAAIKALIPAISASARDGNVVREAHSFISGTMNAVYSIDDTRRASLTLKLNKGSCAQRMVCVEALARAAGVPTRVRALWLDRSFWFARLPLLKKRLPPRTLMPWPQFYLGERWVDFDEIYAPLPELAANAPYAHAFTNAGESLFDAVKHTPVDLLGKLKDSPYAMYDVSRFVVEDAGFFDTRDKLYETLGEQTSWLGKLVFDLLYGGRPIKRQAD